MAPHAAALLTSKDEKASLVQIMVTKEFKVCKML